LTLRLAESRDGLGLPVAGLDEEASMISRRTGLAILATAAVGLLGASGADAGSRVHLNLFPFGPAYDDYYSGPIFVPAPRYYYYEPRRRHLRPRYYTYQYEPDYYEPEVDPEYLPPPRVKKSKLPTSKTVTKSVQKTTGTLSCGKASKIVSDYGFNEVTPTSCGGKVYAFQAKRDGKPFSIKVSSASGELTEVKKQ
jgi:hypothetical protein